jgi:hypothetical protein
MKKLMASITILSFCILFSSCNDDDPNEMMDENQELIKGFNINTESYETPNAYLIFNSVVQYDSETMQDVDKISNRFSFAFTDGKAISYDNKIMYSTDVNQLSYHHFRDIDNTDVLDDIQSVDIAVKIYSQSASSTTKINMSNDMLVDYTANGVDFGNASLAGINYLLSNEDLATFTVNNINMDYELMTGTINCEYSISPSFDGPITGKYIGSFEILVK